MPTFLYFRPTAEIRSQKKSFVLRRGRSYKLLVFNVRNVIYPQLERGRKTGGCCFGAGAGAGEKFIWGQPLDNQSLAFIYTTYKKTQKDEELNQMKDNRGQFKREKQAGPFCFGWSSIYTTRRIQDLFQHPHRVTHCDGLWSSLVHIFFFLSTGMRSIQDKVIVVLLYVKKKDFESWTEITSMELSLVNTHKTPSPAFV